MSDNLWKAIHEKQYSVRYNDRQFSVRYMKNAGVPAAIIEASRRLGIRETSFIKLAVDELLLSLGFSLEPLSARAAAALCREEGIDADRELLAGSRFYRKGAQRLALCRKALMMPAVREAVRARPGVTLSGEGSGMTTLMKLAAEEKLRRMGIDPKTYEI